MINAKIRRLLLDIRNTLEVGLENCFGIMALCNNCLNKCNKQKTTKKIIDRIDEILEEI